VAARPRLLTSCKNKPRKRHRRRSAAKCSKPTATQRHADTRSSTRGGRPAGARAAPRGVRSSRGGSKPRPAAASLRPRHARGAAAARRASPPAREEGAETRHCPLTKARPRNCRDAALIRALELGASSRPVRSTRLQRAAREPWMRARAAGSRVTSSRRVLCSNEAKTRARAAGWRVTSSRHADAALTPCLSRLGSLRPIRPPSHATPGRPIPAPGAAGLCRGMPEVSRRARRHERPLPPSPSPRMRLATEPQRPRPELAPARPGPAGRAGASRCGGMVTGCVACFETPRGRALRARPDSPCTRGRFSSVLGAPEVCPGDHRAHQ